MSGEYIMALARGRYNNRPDNDKTEAVTLCCTTLILLITDSGAMSHQAVTRLDKRMLIGGEWVNADERTAVVHPFDGEPVGSVPMATEEQVTEAIDAAETAFEVSDLSAYQRYELLSKTARQIEERADEIARILTSEQGKPLTEAR